MAADQPMSVPDFDTLRMNPQHLSHFFDGQHSGLAETVIPRCKLITPLNASHDARGEEQTFAGLQTLAVQDSSDLRIRVVVEQPIDRGNYFRAGLPLLPRSLG